MHDIDTKFQPITDTRLGGLNKINSSEFGVGGLLAPRGGVRPAIKLMLSAMKAGAKFYFQSDIKSFFTAIPTAVIVKLVLRETQDHLFSELFERALEVHLENEDELESYRKLFLSGGIGVAQGGSLSAFAGNALLYED